KTYPNVNIVFQGLTDYENDILTLINGGDYGDICMIPSSMASTELGNYFTSFGTPAQLSDKYIEAYLTGGAYFDGQVYGLAAFGAVNGVVYNKKVFEAAGYTEANLPKTPEEFMTCLRAIKEKTDAIPLYTNTQAQWTLNDWESVAMVAGTGDAEYRNNGVVADVNAFAPGSALYEFDKILYDIVKEGLCESDPFTSDWEACKGMINRGEIGCMVLGNWAIPQMQQADVNADDIGYMPFPYSINGEQYAPGNCDKCYGVNVNSKYQAEAIAFVDFMLNESGMAQKSGGISIVIGDEMPAGLELFANVTTIIPSPETNSGHLADVEAEAGMKLCDGARISEVVTAAQSGADYDALVSEWQTYWADAVEALN
ncbi:MAG: extracellular solute-binding protein, partial [Oscillospiraceae bacterium]|nr:extracellular solute-binding protein [Oscillospiraceae bacterium]